VLLDFAMPGMSGAEVAQQVRAQLPGVPILYITGFADRSALTGVSETEIIRKPFVDNELAEKVWQAVTGAGRANVVRLRR
jgi:CheY-like chemotaxis protein